jgi:hypothetical protein
VGEGRSRDKIQGGPMINKNLNIIQFIEILNIPAVAISVAQKAVLKSFYGLPLSPDELEIFKYGTGRNVYVPREQDELSVLAGRQSGKTSVIAALIALYEAFRDHGVRPGQRAYVLIIAPVIQQAEIAFKFIRQYLLESPILAQYVSKIKKDEIELQGGITIACRPCSYISIRGVPVICAILDELAFWNHEPSSANPEEEVLHAIRPAMATLTKTKLIKISTPFRKEGILWDEFQRRDELDHFVWQLSSQEMNPSISVKFLEKARDANESTFRREHLAEFTDSAFAWIPPELLEPCILRGRRELPPIAGGTYVAAVDPAFQRSDFGFAILHRSDAGDVTVVSLESWTGSKTVPLDFEIICDQIRQKLAIYDINAVAGDQFCYAMLKQYFSKLGIFYRQVTFGASTRAKLFGNLRQLIFQRNITILDHPELLHQLRSLEEIKTANGNVDVRTPDSCKDDLAVAVALAALELSGPITGKYDPVIRGTVEVVVTGTRSVGGYAMGSNCGKFPGCWDRGHSCECYGC